jgi:hypothetical protein
MRISMSLFEMIVSTLGLLMVAVGVWWAMIMGDDK